MNVIGTMTKFVNTTKDGKLITAHATHKEATAARDMAKELGVDTEVSRAVAEVNAGYPSDAGDDTCTVPLSVGEVTLEQAA